LTFSEHIALGEHGHLFVEDVDCIDLAQRFGTPTYVLSEAQMRTNARAMLHAFRSRYPKTEVLFSNKANNNPAVRSIFNAEGCGGDCFGFGELHLSLLVGSDPDTIMLNGSNKQPPELELAIRAGVTINLDSLHELELVTETAQRVGRPARVAPRTRLMLHALDDVVADWPDGTPVGPGARAHKFGMHFEDVLESCRRALASEWLELRGLHHHVGRWTNDAGMYRAVVSELLEWAARLSQMLDGWAPAHIDVGGGLAWGRAQGHGPGNHDVSAPTCDTYAEVIVNAFAAGLARYPWLGEPTLMVEPGRALASNIGVLLSRVGTVKTWPGVKTWVNVDASQNHLPNILSAGWYYHAVAAANAAPAEVDLEQVDLVGPLCTFDVMGGARRLPPLHTGDIVAFLDTGAYGETKAATFNAQPRPATVLVSGMHADVITQRETLEQVIGRYRVPERLRTAAAAQV
jgi:diaminopimelate decarboxylase